MTTHTEDPRTGCWTPAEGHTAESVYELFRGERPFGTELVQLCPSDECANPNHLRPTFHVTADDVAELFGVPAEILVGPISFAAEPAEMYGLETTTEFVEPEQEPEAPAVSPEPTPVVPVPVPPVKRGPGRPRKHPR